MIKAQRIDHINLVVSDMDASLAFYARLGLCKTLDTILSGGWIARIVGIAAPDLKARCVFLEPEDGGSRLELIQYLVPKGEEIDINSRANTVGVRHFALAVADIEHAYHELMRAGVSFFSAPQDVPVSQSDVISHIGRKKLAYLLDPDGIIVELTEYVPA